MIQLRRVERRLDSLFRRIVDDQDEEALVRASERFDDLVLTFESRVYLLKRPYIAIDEFEMEPVYLAKTVDEARAAEAILRRASPTP